MVTIKATKNLEETHAEAMAITLDRRPIIACLYFQRKHTYAHTDDNAGDIRRNSNIVASNNTTGGAHCNRSSDCYNRQGNGSISYRNRTSKWISRDSTGADRARRLNASHRFDAGR